MANVLIFLPLLVIFTSFSPIVCAGSNMFNGRHDPHLEALIRSRFKIGTSELKKQAATQRRNPVKHNERVAKDSTVDKNIRSLFSTNFGPGLYLFRNTEPFVNRAYFNTNHDQMVLDQPNPYVSPSLPSYKHIISNQELDRRNQNSSGSKNISENQYQTSWSDGSLKKDKSSQTLPAVNNTHTKSVDESDNEQPSNELDISDCLEEDEVKNNKSFCSHLRNYPERNHLEQLIKKKFPNLESFFGEDLVLPQNISQRMNNAPNEEFLCRSRVRVIYPQSGQNKDWDWFYIVNSPQYKQGIRIEECIEPFKTCGENLGLSLPNHFTATCEQNYIYRSLIAYNKDIIFKDSFRVPSCCKCVLRSYL